MVMFCGRTARFVLGPGGNPEDRFCHDSAHLSDMFSVHLALQIYGKPFYYLSGNVDILFNIYQISYIVHKISNIYQISYILYWISYIIY